MTWTRGEERQCRWGCLFSCLDGVKRIDMLGGGEMGEVMRFESGEMHRSLNQI